MPRYEVCLIDVYQTVLTVDFAYMNEQLAGIAGVSAEEFRDAANAYASEVTDGRLTMADAMRAALRACGKDPDVALVRRLVDSDRRLLIAATQLYDDTLGFLEVLRERHVRSAFVSNCAENTRPLLAHLGLDALVDAVVLSCEVGWAKPAPQIYREALAGLDAEPRVAVLVDDRAAYCEGATRIGIAAAQIVRGGKAAPASADGTTVVGSLTELERFF